MENPGARRVPTYGRAWNIENVVYAIQKIQLPFPISVRQGKVFAAVIPFVVAMYFIPSRGGWLVWAGLLPALTVWVIQRNGVRFDDGSLPQAVRLGLLYGAAEAVLLLLKGLLYLGHRSWGLWLILPFAVTWYLTKQRLDGRDPLKWCMVMARWIFMPKNLNRFRRQAFRDEFFMVAIVLRKGRLRGLKRLLSRRKGG